MEVFLNRVHQLLPVLGCAILVPLVESPSKDSTVKELVCSIKGLQARGQRSPQGFVVFKGSAASLSVRPSAEQRGAWVISLRNLLLSKGVLAKESDKLIFVQDYEFSSPSAAAAVVHGGHANGLTAWKTKDGTTLKEIEGGE